jgi:tRNA pseudouridine38-40 synthase
MRDAAKIFIGEHNFASYCSYDQYGNTIRTLYQFDISEENGIITFKVIGNGFRRYMVRHLVGGLIQVGAKRVTKEKLLEMLESEGEKKCLFKAKPQGLYLYDVYYEDKTIDG